MSTTRLLVASIAACLPLLAACGDYAGGYDKVMFRERTPLAMAAAPNPPPVVAGIGAGAAATPVLSADIAPPGVTQVMVEDGQQLFGTVCAACHGSGGAGSPAGPVLRDQEWIHITGNYDEIVTLIQTGVPAPRDFPAAMPPLGGGSFSPDQVRALAAYVFALSHQPGV